MGLTCHSCESSCVTLNHRVVRMPCYICYTDMVVHLFFLIKRKKKILFFFSKSFRKCTVPVCVLVCICKRKTRENPRPQCICVCKCYFFYVFFLMKKMKYTKKKLTRLTQM